MEAAQILGMSYTELDGHPDKAELMRRAFTYQQGKANGEYLLQVNPAFQKASKEQGEAINKTISSVGG